MDCGEIQYKSYYMNTVCSSSFIICLQDVQKKWAAEMILFTDFFSFFLFFTGFHFKPDTKINDHCKMKATLSNKEAFVGLMYLWVHVEIVP